MPHRPKPGQRRRNKKRSTGAAINSDNSGLRPAWEAKNGVEADRICAERFKQKLLTWERDHKGDLPISSSSAVPFDSDCGKFFSGSHHSRFFTDDCVGE